MMLSSLSFSLLTTFNTQLVPLTSIVFLASLLCYVVLKMLQKETNIDSKPH